MFKSSKKISKFLKTILFKGKQMPRQDDIHKVFARLFLSEDGKRVLAHLQNLTFERSLGAEASDAALRYSEGQRALLVLIFRLVDQGRK